MEFDDLSNRVIGCAIEVHRELGPGLLESTYEQCLAHELRRNGIPFQVQYPQPVEYKDIRLDCGYRIDILIENKLILELKIVEEIKGIHEACPLCGGELRLIAFRDKPSWYDVMNSPSRPTWYQRSTVGAEKLASHLTHPIESAKGNVVARATTFNARSIPLHPAPG